tara:strand:- start:30 stop:284 length:255 start_codon:yes stop_codon:yes gene_type:complete
LVIFPLKIIELIIPIFTKISIDNIRDIIINKYNECRKIVFAFPFSFDAINSGMNLVIACGNGSGDIIGIGKQNVANVANKYIII